MGPGKPSEARELGELSLKSVLLHHCLVPQARQEGKLHFDLSFPNSGELEKNLWKNQVFESRFLGVWIWGAHEPLTLSLPAAALCSHLSGLCPEDWARLSALPAQGGVRVLQEQITQHSGWGPTNTAVCTEAWAGPYPRPPSHRASCPQQGCRAPSGAALGPGMTGSYTLSGAVLAPTVVIKGSLVWISRASIRTPLV